MKRHFKSKEFNTRNRLSHGGYAKKENRRQQEK